MIDYKLNIREARREDAPFIFDLICMLAEFEKARDRVINNVDQLIEDGFGERPLYFSHILELDGKPAGFTLCFYAYSTWKGKSLYLEDLFVLPECRGKGLAKLALKFLKEYANKEKCERFHWQVLDWNEPAIEFYKTLGAELDGEWINCRLEGDALKTISS